MTSSLPAASAVVLLATLTATGVLAEDRRARWRWADGERAGDRAQIEPPPVEAPPEVLEERNEECLDCHSDPDEDEIVTFPDGTTLAVAVDEESFAASVHGDNTSCKGCHRTGYDDHPHADLEAATARDYGRQQTATCRRCHYAYYTRVIDGIHFKLLQAGRDEAPSCVDCHTAHAMPDPTTPAVAANDTCGRCHEEELEQYKQSVHGKALAGKHPEDAPLCIDCHGAHRISDPRRSADRVRGHEVCAGCHADEEMMARHDLTADVMTSYLQDFHGVSNRLYARGAGAPARRMASCSDCHGIHDVRGFDASEEGEKAVRERLTKVCGECHKDVDQEFTKAWMSHYPPTLAGAPLVWAVTWGYRLLIPLIMFGLIGHILLHLWSLRWRRRD